MDKNPYSRLVALVREQSEKGNPPPIRLGIISFASEQPFDIRVKLDDIEVDKDNLLISEHLIQGYSKRLEKISVTSNTGTATLKLSEPQTYEVKSVDIDFANDGSGEITYKTDLQQGDIVAVIPTHDRQTYIVLCKVVSLNG
ncbi:DUF2577 family protein [Peptoclostridium acidaminophilum]|uniref:DUF2577 family protein n=1 Tax=Peptoclostridium acidaminophilum TaxID=1731 RepID=UPI00046CE00C|nr:DUF2577 family protein [Peptoclostridium acidaminophilum]